MKQTIEELKEQLQRQEKMASIGLLTAGIAHEVQNPLNFVINFSKLSAELVADLAEIVEGAADKLTDDEREDLQEIISELRGNMQKIQEHGNRATSIVRSILLQSRGKQGEFLPTDIVELIHEYVWLSYHAMRANDKTFNISIHEEYPDTLPKVMVIPQDISRAVLNIVNNACYTVKERTERGEAGYQPAITVKVTAFERVQNADKSLTLRIEITDNGMGMSDEVKEHLYENFFTTKPAGKGTGLGMGITHEIITQRHHGELLVESTEGVGTTFTLIIPVKTL